MLFSLDFIRDTGDFEIQRFTFKFRLLINLFELDFKFYIKLSV